MVPKIMLLSESCQIEKEAIRYSTALAERLDAAIVLLMLLAPESSGNISSEMNAVFKLQTRGEAAIRQPVNEMKKAGIPVEPVIRIGDPRSEFIKYLAESERFHSIIWGGDVDSIHKKHHWTSNLEAEVKCTVLIPYAKTESAGPANRRTGSFNEGG